VLVVWTILTVLAWWRRNPVLRFSSCFFVIAPMPLELLEGRTAACLAIPFCALAIFAATVLTDFAAWVSRGRRWMFAVVLAIPLISWEIHTDRLKRELIRAQMRAFGQETWSVIRQLREIRPQVRPNSTIIFLDDPFDGFDMAFIAELWFRQPGLNIRLHKKTPFTPDELAKADHLFAWEQGKLSQIR
jgi:hypothetical protein